MTNLTKFTLEGPTLEPNFLRCLTCDFIHLQANSSRLFRSFGRIFCQIPFLSCPSLPHPITDESSSLNWGILLFSLQLLGQKEQSSLLHFHIVKHTEKLGVQPLAHDSAILYSLKPTEHYPWIRKKDNPCPLLLFMSSRISWWDWGNCRAGLLSCRAQGLPGECWQFWGMWGEAAVRGLCWLPSSASMTQELHS